MLGNYFIVKQPKYYTIYGILLQTNQDKRYTLYISRKRERDKLVVQVTGRGSKNRISFFLATFFLAKTLFLAWIEKQQQVSSSYLFLFLCV